MPADDHPSVARVRARLSELGAPAQISTLDEHARTAAGAAAGLGIAVGQIASSIVFGLPVDGEQPAPLLVVTSGAHRVDTERVAAHLGVPRLLRADADLVRQWSGFAIGGVSPVGWTQTPAVTLIDEDLAQYDIVWAAAGHPHCVFPTTFDELVRMTGGTPADVGD